MPSDITNPGAMLSSSVAGSSFVVGKDGSPPQQIVIGSNIQLGGSAAAVALCTKIDSLITLLTQTYTPSGTETGFATLITALISWKAANWTVPTTGSLNVKAS
jgi:hypothetical protein